MSHPDIEPWAAKTLLLLRSTASNSLEEMRTMLIDTIHQKYSGRKQFKPIPPLSGPISDPFEKIKSKEPKVSNPLDVKTSKTQSGSTSGFSSPSINLASPESLSSESDNSVSENSDMVILDDELHCAVCKESRQSWKPFVECAECHALYHQQCHVPPISDSDVTDPRTVWYCRNCTKTLNKQKPSSSTSSSTSSKDKANTSGSSKGPTGRTASPSFANKTFGGSSIPGKKSSSGKSSSSTSSKVAPNLNMVSADKRLQIMKKKAAKKQEKRLK